MTNEELISILMEFPLKTEVEACHPVIEQSVIKFRAGCDQSHCQLIEVEVAKEKKLKSFISNAKGIVANMGKDKTCPEPIKKKLRGLYSYILDLEK